MAISVLCWAGELLCGTRTSTCCRASTCGRQAAAYWLPLDIEKKVGRSLRLFATIYIRLSRILFCSSSFVRYIPFILEFCSSFYMREKDKSRSRPKVIGCSDITIPNFMFKSNVLERRCWNIFKSITKKCARKL